MDRIIDEGCCNSECYYNDWGSDTGCCADLSTWEDCQSAVFEGEDEDEDEEV